MRVLAMIALVLGLFAPQIGFAQSTENDTGEVPMTEVAPSEEQPAEPVGVVEELPAEEQVPEEQAQPTVPSLPVRDLSGDPRAYLSIARRVPGTLYGYELDVKQLIRNLQLGAISQDRAAAAMNRLAVASSGVAARTQRVIAPPQLADVQDLLATATEESRLAIQITSESTLSGESVIPVLAASHFAQSFRMASQALLILDGA